MTIRRRSLRPTSAVSSVVNSRREFITGATGLVLATACKPGGLLSPDSGASWAALDLGVPRACSEDDVETAQLVVSVTDAHGRPAQGGLTVRSLSAAKASEVTLPESGTVTLMVPTRRLHAFEVHAIDCEQLEGMLRVDSDAHVQIRMGTYQAWATVHESTTTALTLRVVWADEDGKTPDDPEEVAAPISDGVARVTLNAPAYATHVRYQIAIGGAHDRWVNGTMEHSWIYDDGGDYYSQRVLSKARQVEIAIAVRDLPEPGLPTRVDWGGAQFWFDGAVKWPLHDLFHELNTAISSIAQSYENGLWLETQALGAGFRETLAIATRQARDLEDPVARDVALARLLAQAAAVDHRLDAVGPEVLEIAAAIESSSPAWVVPAAMLGDFADMEGGEELVDKARSIARTNDDASIVFRALASLVRVAHGAGRREEVDDLLDAMRTSGCSSSITKLTADLIAGDRKLPPGAFAQHLFKARRGGVSFALPQREPAVWLLDFWAPWCEPCIHELPHLHRAYYQLNDVPLDVAAGMPRIDDPKIGFVSFSAESDREQVKELRTTRWPMPWQHVVMSAADVAFTRDRWGVVGWPTLILVDGSGKVLERGRHLYGTRLVGVLERYVS